MHLSPDQEFTPWLLDPSIFDEDQGDRIELRQVVEPEVNTVKLDNLVPPRITSYNVCYTKLLRSTAIPATGQIP